MRWLLWNVDWSLENNRIHCSSGASLQATGLAHEMHGRRQLPQSCLGHEPRRWLVLAGKDLNSARLLMAEEPANSVFHSQQAAEKAAKAFLAFHNIPFRKTHDLKELGAQCVAVDSSLSSLLEEAANLTEYAVVFRYLDAPRELDDAEAAGALETARRVCEQVRVAVALGGEP